MKKITTLMVLLMSLALSACAKNTTNEGKPNTDPETNQPGGNTDTGEGNTNPDQGGDTEGGETEGGDQGGNTDPDQGGDQPGGNTDPDQGGGNEGGTTDDIPDQNPNRPTLPCGAQPLPRPENATNPIQISPSREPDVMLTERPDYYRVISGNNFDNSLTIFYAPNNQGGGLPIKYKDDTKIKGIQTPIWQEWDESWIKVEVRFTINFWQGNNTKGEPTKNPYVFYGFDIQGNLIDTHEVATPNIQDEDHYKNNENDPYIDWDITNTPEHRKIRYVELRVQDFVCKGSKTYTTVFSNCRIREYHSTKNQ